MLETPHMVLVHSELKMHFVTLEPT